MLSQAVILAGGQGTRLRPLTDNTPKPLVQVNGQPFLSYLLNQLKAQGIQDVLILTGYLGHQVRDYCGDGGKWGLTVRCVESPIESETGQRLREAAGLFDPHFLLMYCDNYWPMNLPDMWQAYLELGKPTMVTVYSNRDNYSRSNVRVGEDGMLTAYDPDRKTQGLNGVEIGYAIISRDVVRRLPTRNVRFEHTVYPSLVASSSISAFRTEHRYYGVGSFDRLALSESFLKPQRAVILDRDGVLNERPAVAHYVRNWEEFKWLDGSFEGMRLLKDAGYKIMLASNQSGIARGMMTEGDLKSVHNQMNAELAQQGLVLDAIYYCPHGWEDGCFCRKPSPGMLFQAQRDFHLDLTKTLFIGDDERDQEAGHAAGCITALVSPGRKLLDVVQEYLAKERASV